MGEQLFSTNLIMGFGDIGQKILDFLENEFFLLCFTVDCCQREIF